MTSSVIVHNLLSSVSAYRIPYLLILQLLRNSLRRRVVAPSLDDLALPLRPPSTHKLTSNRIECSNARLPPLPERVQSNAECAAEHPQNSNNDPACKELLAEDVAGAIHGHGP
jgi:hypothetical protein